MDIKEQINNFKKENVDIPNYILLEMKKYISKDITEKQLGKILENIKKEYFSSLISPYESIGIISAQSVGAEATQMTLNTFHFAGVSTHSVEGLPRLIEILDVKKNLTSPQMRIYLKKGNYSEAKFKILGNKIKETPLLNYSKNVDIDVVEKLVTIEIDVLAIKKFDLTMEDIIALVDKKVRASCSFEKNKIIFKAKELSSIKDLMSAKEILLNSIITGIKGIKDISLIKENDEIVIITSGIALKQILLLDEVDGSRIYSNDVFEMFNMFGIETAREVIIKEIDEIVNSQGLSINQRHVFLIADAMTYSGEPKGMTRYGIVSNKKNVLTRASFETAIKHITSAALIHERNKLTSITENIMTNQIVNVGTGIPKISVKKR